MTQLGLEDSITREIPSMRIRWTKRAADHARALIILIDAFGVSVRGKGLPSSEVRLSYDLLRAYAARHTSGRVKFDSGDRIMARTDAVRAIRAAFPDRADRILTLLGLE